eukprot:1758576-Rhodomonas_salina.3
MDGKERVARCKLGPYYERRPDGSNSVLVPAMLLWKRGPVGTYAAMVVWYRRPVACCGFSYAPGRKWYADT